VSQEKSESYIVQPGDTLYAIAWRYNMDYRILAEQNHLSSPYVVKVGQKISLKPILSQSLQTLPSPKKTIKNEPISQKNNPALLSTPITTSSSKQPIQWVWPAKGKIIAHYSPTVSQKGIDIAGQEGEPILAAASGKVAYCGNGLRGYGNLIIIKHNEEFLSAYAHNQTLLVHEGEEVKAGQKIATMGKSESKRVMLHFEIREAGKSVNPLLYVKP
jgi:lipoprotein NlpD